MKKDKIIFFIISTVLGVLIGFQFNTVDSVREANITPGKEGEKLISEIDKINEEKENLQEEIKERSKVLKKYEKNIMDKKTKGLIDEVEKYKMLCGYEEVEGPGIIIDINDLHDDSLYYSDDQVLIEKKELLTFIVNILRMAGSEAISINDLRITAYTEIEVAGRHFEINGMSTNTPFSIKVIGNQNDLYKISETLTDDEYFDIKIKKMNNITVPKFNKVIEFKDAEPIIEGTK
ncbi:DUF881 domain-containing protein [Anaerosalibacter massiliensis]|uniref:DUF881 domain-containing protein n=1 Tax=Anaerosalibacter massiliensis TaxID=1347392 RepID=A0A9X2S6S0_9FIRM|nr:DUF881 domain-containing protein [Anaerosalibacter massiliensis]MCR2043937.1 DUF881 domain-containing protein [Anaerosalibacter massiliensis]